MSISVNGNLILLDRIIGNFQLSVMGGRKNRRNGSDSFRNNRPGNRVPTVSKTLTYSSCELLAEGHHFFLPCMQLVKRERKNRLGVIRKNIREKRHDSGQHLEDILNLNVAR